MNRLYYVLRLTLQGWDIHYFNRHNRVHYVADYSPRHIKIYPPTHGDYWCVSAYRTINGTFDVERTHEFPQTLLHEIPKVCRQILAEYQMDEVHEQ